MTVFQALNKMKELTRLGKSFSFSFMSYSSSRDKSEGIIEVSSAKLRKGTSDKDLENGDLLINYFNLDTFEDRRFYLPLLMSFNGQKLEIYE